MGMLKSCKFHILISLASSCDTSTYLPVDLSATHATTVPVCAFSSTRDTWNLLESIVASVPLMSPQTTVPYAPRVIEATSPGRSKFSMRVRVCLDQTLTFWSEPPVAKKSGEMSTMQFTNSVCAFCSFS